MQCNSNRIIPPKMCSVCLTLMMIRSCNPQHGTWAVISSDSNTALDDEHYFVPSIWTYIHMLQKKLSSHGHAPSCTGEVSSTPKRLEGSYRSDISRTKCTLPSTRTDTHSFIRSCFKRSRINNINSFAVIGLFDSSINREHHPISSSVTSELLSNLAALRQLNRNRNLMSIVHQLFIQPMWSANKTLRAENAMLRNELKLLRSDAAHTSKVLQDNPPQSISNAQATKTQHSENNQHIISSSNKVVGDGSVRICFLGQHRVRGRQEQ